MGQLRKMSQLEYRSRMFFPASPREAWNKKERRAVKVVEDPQKEMEEEKVRKATKTRKAKKKRVAVARSRNQPPYRESREPTQMNVPNPGLEENPLQGKPIAQFASGTSKANATKDPPVMIGIQPFALFMLKAVASLESLVVSFTRMAPQQASNPQLKQKQRLRQKTKVVQHLSQRPKPNPKQSNRVKLQPLLAKVPQPTSLMRNKQRMITSAMMNDYRQFHSKAPGNWMRHYLAITLSVVLLFNLISKLLMSPVTKQRVLFCNQF